MHLLSLTTSRQLVTTFKNDCQSGKQCTLGTPPCKKAGYAPAPEAWKEGRMVWAKVFHALLNKICNEEDIPQDWKVDILVKLPRKGDLCLCKNWRPIMLVTVASKVLCKIILERMKDALECRPRDEQAGFLKERSCCDQIATLTIIVEQTLEWNSGLYMVFVNFEDAFDSIDREVLWKILRGNVH